MDTPMLSRSGYSHPDGKRDREVTVLLTEALENKVITMATLRKESKSEYIFKLVERVLDGEFSMYQKIATRGE